MNKVQAQIDANIEELVAWLDSVRDDPVAFVEGAFDWGHGELEKSSGPEPWQRWLLEQIRDGLMQRAKQSNSQFPAVMASARARCARGLHCGPSARFRGRAASSPLHPKLCS